VHRNDENQDRGLQRVDVFNELNAAAARQSDIGQHEIGPKVCDGIKGVPGRLCFAADR
jgi:hypothetical protein